MGWKAENDAEGEIVHREDSVKVYPSNFLFTGVSGEPEDVIALA